MVKRIGILIVVSVIFLTLVANFTILSYRSGIISSLETVEHRPVAFIFGGGMLPDGSMSDLQTDRVLRGIQLYEQGSVDRIIMTGDDGTMRFDEVHAMHDAAVAAGVPDEAVDIDPAGFTTFASCERAATVYDIPEAIVVSQQFHLPRILYFCSEQGIDVIGVPADLREYSWYGHLWGMGVREVLARVKGYLTVHEIL